MCRHEIMNHCINQASTHKNQTTISLPEILL
jgi:hypothetical protein